MPRSDINRPWGNRERQYHNSENRINGIPRERARLLGIEEHNVESDSQQLIGVDLASGVGCYTTSPISTLRYEMMTPEFIYPNYDWGRLAETFSGITSGIGVSRIQNSNFKYIKPYNYIPENFNFNKLDHEKEDLFLGVELEIDDGGEKDENAKMILDTLGEDNIYCMHDGSLRNGIEITTHPCSYEYHKQMKYKEAFEKAIELGYKSHNTLTCGLHIHFNKDYFSTNKTIQDLYTTQLLYLFEKFWDNIVKFSRRDSDNVNRWSKRYNMSENETMFDVMYKAKQAQYNNSKYYAINLQHKDTIEIRVFRGTLKYNTFIATLQFVKRIVNLCKNLNIIEIQDLTWNDIIKDCEEELEVYLEERKLL